MCSPTLKAAAVAGVWRAAPSLLASPSQKLADVQSLLHEAGVAENVICFEAHSPLALSTRPCAAGWRIAGISPNKMRCTEAFIALFRPLLLLRDCDPSELTPDRCFQIQLLLIHFYRRVVLKDPLLPEELLRRRIGQGQTARQLCINIYQRVSPGALAFVSEKGESSVGELGAGSALLSALWRFAGRIRRLHADISD